MSGGYHLTATNAPRRCGVCGTEATAYLHSLGFRCGDCHDEAPNERADAGKGGSIE